MTDDVLSDKTPDSTSSSNALTVYKFFQPFLGLATRRKKNKQTNKQEKPLIYPQLIQTVITMGFP